MDYASTPTLSGSRVRLERLGPAHADDLAESVADRDLWRPWYTHIPSPDGMAAEIERRLQLQREGRMAPWAVVDARTGRLWE